MSEDIKYLSDDDFETSISKGVALVDFYADWCGPCRMIAPVVEELASEFKGQVTVAKIDIESSQKTPATLGVMSIPTLIFFKNGKEVDRLVGVKRKEDIIAHLKKLF